MAGASDKARFYLEQSIPELQELERKKIFTKDEIISITKKRSDFEHKLNARGSCPADYARYAEYEMNLESLRRKRAKRLAVKASGHAGQRRIFFVLERSTRKFQGDLALWMQYLQFARSQKAFKRVAQVLTNVLRLHPTKPQLWIYAANYAMEVQGDMIEARSYMQRGLRFCKQSKELWLEYAKLELLYVAKIAARRHILGLDEQREDRNSMGHVDDLDADHVALPSITAEDIDPSLQIESAIDEETLRTLSTTPALSGAITIAIFDAALSHFNDPQLGERFFDMVADFKNIPCRSKILQHMVDRLIASEPRDPASLNCFIRQPLVGISPRSVAFPKSLGSALSRLKSSTAEHLTPKLVGTTVKWLAQYLEDEDLDPDIRKVLSVTLKKTLSQYLVMSKKNVVGSSEEFTGLVEIVRSRGLEQLADSMASSSLEMWPSSGKSLAS